MTVCLTRKCQLPSGCGNAADGCWLTGAAGTRPTSSYREYDFYYSAIAWYRDYAAYCGMADDGKRVNAIVAQIGRRQPVLKKTLGELSAEDSPDSACAAPSWQRRPARVTFEPEHAPKFTYAIRGHAAIAVVEEDNDETAAK